MALKVTEDLKLRMVSVISNLVISRGFTLACAEFDDLALIQLEIESIHRKLMEDNPN